MPKEKKPIAEIQGKRVAECIKLCGIKQKDIAKKLNYTQQHISYIVHGKRALSEESAKKLADLFSDLLPPKGSIVFMPDWNSIERDPYNPDYLEIPSHIDYRYLLGEIDSYAIKAPISLTTNLSFFSGIKAILRYYGYNIRECGVPFITDEPSLEKLKTDTRETAIIKTKTGEKQTFSTAEMYFLFRDFFKAISGIMDSTFYKHQYENMEMPIWAGYEVYDDNGFCKVRDDAPDEVKAAFADYLQNMKKTNKDGIKL